MLINFGDRYEALAEDTIHQALLDVRGYPLRSKQTNEKLRKEALAWFNDGSDKPFGYRWCLGLSGSNPNGIRQQINKWCKIK